MRHWHGIAITDEPSRFRMLMWKLAILIGSAEEKGHRL
jgi:hypothetical protein